MLIEVTITQRDTKVRNGKRERHVQEEIQSPPQNEREELKSWNNLEIREDGS